MAGARSARRMIGWLRDAAGLESGCRTQPVPRKLVPALAPASARSLRAASRCCGFEVMAASRSDCCRFAATSGAITAGRSRAAATGSTATASVARRRWPGGWSASSGVRFAHWAGRCPRRHRTVPASRPGSAGRAAPRSTRPCWLSRAPAAPGPPPRSAPLASDLEAETYFEASLHPARSARNRGQFGARAVRAGRAHLRNAATMMTGWPADRGDFLALEHLGWKGAQAPRWHRIRPRRCSEALRRRRSGRGSNG